MLGRRALQAGAGVVIVLITMLIGGLPTAASDDFHLSFDGLDDRVLVPWNASFPTEVFSVSASIRLTAPPTRRAAIIARGEDDESFNLSWQLYVIPDGTLEAMLEASNEDNYCYPNNDCVPFGTCESGDLFVADGAWHQVALSRDQSGTLVFYIDGQERARCQGTGLPSSNNRQFLSFGATHGAIGPLPPGATEPPIWFFPGEIDDLAMWNTSLAATEIEALYQDGVDPKSSGLVGFWNLDEGQGQEVNDLSPAQNHGYLGADPAADSADPVWSAGPLKLTPTPCPAEACPVGGVAELPEVAAAPVEAGGASGRSVGMLVAAGAAGVAVALGGVGWHARRRASTGSA